MPAAQISPKPVDIRHILCYTETEISPITEGEYI